MKRHFYWPLILSCVMACNPSRPLSTVTPAATGSALAATTLASPSLQTPPTVAPTSEAFPTIPPTPASETPTPLGLATDQPAFDALSTSLRGLVYQTSQGLWLVNSSGMPAFVINQTEARISPDGRYAAYWYWEIEAGANDIWLADLHTNDRRNLTHSPDLVDRDPQWWPARPEVIIFGTQAEVAPGVGNLSVVNIDGSGYTVLDKDGAGPFALSPDGQMIAYGCCGPTGKLYHWGRGNEKFDPASYGLTAEKVYMPAWSPDGRLLAWEVGGNLTADGSWGIGLAIFDLQAHTSRLLHPYAPTAGASTPHDVSWSPDGRWLAFATWNEAVSGAQLIPVAARLRPNLGGPFPQLWVLSRDGAQEVSLGPAEGAVWSPDGRWLAFNREGAAWVAEVPGWRQHRLFDPGISVVDWLPLGRK